MACGGKVFAITSNRILPADLLKLVSLVGHAQETSTVNSITSFSLLQPIPLRNFSVLLVRHFGRTSTEGCQWLLYLLQLTAKTWLYLHTLLNCCLYLIKISLALDGVCVTVKIQTN